MSQAGLIDIEHANPQIPTEFDADSGNAIPIGNVLNIFGGAGIETSGSGNTITIALTGGGAAIDALTTDVSGPVTPDGGGNVDVTGTSIFSDGSVANTLTLNVQATANTLLYGQGTANNMAEVGPLSDGQLLIGATGSAPVAANLTSADGSVTINNGAGSIDLSVSSSDDAILTLTGDAGGAVSPTGGNIDVQGVAVANAANAKPAFVQGTPGSSLLEVDVQVAAAITGAPGDKNDAGLSSFDDSAFSVDTDGFVQLTNAFGPTVGAWNLGFDYDSGTGVFSITSADGTALSSTNPGYVTLWKRQATDPGKLITIKITADVSFIDDNGASEIIGNLFGTTTGVAYAQNMPFMVKAVLNDDEDAVAFCLTRNLYGKTSPSSGDIGTPSNAVSDEQLDYWSFDDITTTEFDSNPAIPIGIIFMRKSAADDWTVQGLFAGGSGLNIPSPNEIDSNNYLLDTGNFGAATGGYLIDNGGTAPTFTTQSLRYSISPNMVASWFYMNGNTATDGSGAVDAIIALPYTAQATGGSNFIVAGSGYVTSPAYTGIVVFEIQANTLQLKMRDINGNYLQNQDFSDGDRTIEGAVSYRVGGNP